jgi:hypothetical protein
LRPTIRSYEQLALREREPCRLPYPELPAVVSNWDNTPRFGRRGLVLSGSSPECFGDAVRIAVNAVQSLPVDERIVFVKSWNEWAEGNYLEPDRKHGTAYLAALREAIRQVR